MLHATLLLWVATTLVPRAEPLQYVLRIEPAADKVRGELIVPPGLAGPLRVAFPVWAPGKWARVEAWKSVESLEATERGGSVLSVAKDGEGVWVIDRSPGVPVTVRWTLGGWPKRPSAEYFLSPEGALLSPGRTFPYIEGATALPCRIQLVLPGAWKTAWALPKSSTDGAFEAANYHQLNDSPVLLGMFEEWNVDVGKTRVRVVLDRQGESTPLKKLELNKGLERLLRCSAEHFGPPEGERFTILMVETTAGRSGHAGTAVVGVPRGLLSQDDQRPVLLAVAEESLRSVFHHRFRPKAWTPPSLSEVPKCACLWFADGAASWYARLFLLRAGIASKEDFLRDLGATILMYRNHLLAELMSPEAASLAVWEQNLTSSSRIPHELSGQLLGFCLDAMIREGSDGRKTLDQLVRAGMQRFAPGKEGYGPESLEALASEFAEKDLGAFFASHVRASKALPFDDILGRMGLKFLWVSWNVKDPGLFVSNAEGDLQVAAVTPMSALQIAGLRAGDRVLKVNQTDVRTPEDVEAQIARLTPGQKLRVDVRREQKVLSIRITCDPEVALDIPLEVQGTLAVFGSIPPGPLKDAGLLPGDVLEKIDSRRVTRVTDLAEALKRVRRGKVLLTIRRDDKKKLFTIDAPPKVTWRGTLIPDTKAKGPAQERLHQLLQGQKQ